MAVTKEKRGEIMECIQIKMLGEFSIAVGENKISDHDNRTRKIWLLLSYLICQRGRVVPQKKLIEMLWGDEPASSNPENALRITFHRARTLLNRLWPTAGRELILYRDNGYTWNDAIPMTLDAEEFEKLCTGKTQTGETRLENCLAAIALYGGGFLEKQSSEVWVIPVSTHYHNLYISVVMEAAQLLAQEGRHREAAYICRKAAAVEPYHEPLHQMLIRQLALAGDTKAAGEVYDALSKRLFDDFGIRPSQETRTVYREAVHSVSESVLPMDEVLEHLQEPNSLAGAMECDYDYFKVLCYAESRSLERSGNTAYIALLSLGSGPDKPLTRRSINRIMEQLGVQIRTNLRRGDIFSRCSVSQYILMLPMANFENSCMVCRRILGAFDRAHPHVTAKIHYMVQPLSPSVHVP